MPLELNLKSEKGIEGGKQIFLFWCEARETILGVYYGGIQCGV